MGNKINGPFPLRAMEKLLEITQGTMQTLKCKN